jgi:hypothetical protein
MAVCAITAAVVSGAAGVSAAFDAACAVTGEVTFDSLTAVPDQVGLLFDGTSAACSDGSATLGPVAAQLSGTFSCLTGNGTGTLAMHWLDGSVSSAPATLASVAAGVAVLGAFESGPTRATRSPRHSPSPHRLPAARRPGPPAPQATAPCTSTPVRSS